MLFGKVVNLAVGEELLAVSWSEDSGSLLRCGGLNWCVESNRCGRLGLSDDGPVWAGDGDGTLRRIGIRPRPSPQHQRVVSES